MNGWGGKSLSRRDWILSIAIATIWLILVRPGPFSLPYFWDEADVYVPGSLWVAENNLDVTPGVFPDDYSRGHPPLVFLLTGVAFKLFGPEPLVGHLLVFPFAVLALAGVYLLGTLLFGRISGLVGALLLGTTPLFLSIGTMVLPEVFLLCFTVLALIFFCRGNLWTAAFFGALLVLIKETGVFTAGALSAAIFWDALRAHKLKKAVTWKRIALSLSPIAVLCAFFLWQRLSPAGYFVFPHHENLLWERPLSFSDIGTVWPSMVVWNGRWLLLTTALIWAVVHIASGHIRQEIGSETTQKRWQPRPSAVIVAFLVLILENAVFFTKMFWLERYALPAHPGILLIASGILFGKVFRPFQRKWLVFIPIASTVISISLGIAGINARTRPNEEELTFAFADVIKTHQQAYRSLEKHLGEGDHTVLTAWPMTIELRSPYLGYVKGPYKTIHIDSVIQGSRKASEAQAILVPRPSRHSSPLLRQANRLGMKKAGSFQTGNAGTLDLYLP